jgi:hypothetical protein
LQDPHSGSLRNARRDQAGFQSKRRPFSVLTLAYVMALKIPGQPRRILFNVRPRGVVALAGIALVDGE